MAVSKFVKTSGMAALAASMAFGALATDASAQERGRWGGRGEAAPESGGGETRQRWNGEARGNGGGGWQQRQQQAAPPVQAQVAPPVQAQAPVQPRQSWQGNGGGGNWRGRGDAGQAQPQTQPQWNGGNRSAWGQRTQTAPAPQAQAQVQPAPQAPTRNLNGGERRGSWSDGNRNSGQWSGRSAPTPNPTWRDGNRDQRADGWRGNNNRAGDQRNDSWRGNNDRRGDSWRGNNNRDGYRSGYNNNHRDWNRSWRHDNRYNWSSWRNQHRDIYRVGRYYSPYNNWSYRRLSIGFRLDNLFFSSNYWINDPWQYRLPDAYGPYRWVRYYDDALLVDIYSGEVVDTIYDFFW